MEYTDIEKQFLALLDRTDFKNLSKNDVITYASKLNEMRPEVAVQVIAQYPEFIKLMQSLMVECKEILEKVIGSDDASINRVYDIVDKELENASEGRKLFYELANKALSDCSKCLDIPGLTIDELNEIREKEIEILRMADEKDREIRKHEMETLRIADKKDSEKRVFNWKAITAASTVVVALVGIGGAVLGGNLNLKLPHK